MLVDKVDADGKVKDEVTIAAEMKQLIDARSEVKMAEARAEMILRVEDGQLAHMVSRDPQVIWENLEKVHRAAGFATSMALRREFLTSKKTGIETMEAWMYMILLFT